MSNIHASAIVDRRAELAQDVTIGAFAVVGPDVTIGAGTIVGPHSIIQESTVIGQKCQIGPAAYVGFDPQHIGFLTQPDRPQTWLHIGDRTIIRECASLHRATKPGKENATVIGSDCLLMGGAHVAHDCKLAERVVMANAALLGGHVQVGTRAFLGGAAVIHQFVRVGRLAIVAGNEAISRDIPPFAAVRYGGLKGYNAIGCRRAGMDRPGIQSIRAAFYRYHTNRTLPGVVEAIRRDVPETPEVVELLQFITTAKRGVQPSVRFLNYLNFSEAESE